MLNNSLLKALDAAQSILNNAYTKIAYVIPVPPKVKIQHKLVIRPYLVIMFLK